MYALNKNKCLLGAFGVFLVIVSATGCVKVKDNKSPSPIAIPNTPPLFERLETEGVSITHPSQIDSVTRAMGAQPYLFNIYAAKPYELTETELGKTVYIPVQISEAPGGRKSLLFLEPGEETLTGIYVSGDGLALNYVKRVSGNSIPAITGDVYSRRVVSRNGDILWEGDGELEIIDEENGEFKIPYKLHIRRIKGGWLIDDVRCRWFSLKEVTVESWRLWDDGRIQQTSP